MKLCPRLGASKKKKHFALTQYCCSIDISLICDNSVATHNFAFLSYW